MLLKSNYKLLIISVSCIVILGFFYDFLSGPEFLDHGYSCIVYCRMLILLKVLKIIKSFALFEFENVLFLFESE